VSRLFLTIILLALPITASAADRPNILFAFADDWGLHASAYGDPVVKTPNFDRIAREGVLFQNAYISSPSCTPSRGAVLTGHYHWQLDGAANLWSVFPDDFGTYPEFFKQSGYVTGVSGKGWGPGRTATKGRELAGKRFPNFQQFLKDRPKDTPFCYWLGTSDPHRPFKAGSGKAAGMDLSKIDVPACFPDSEVVRSDIADYYVEVQRFDALVGRALASLEELGELDNTMVVMSSDHGMPFPRSKSNLYDSGARVPLAISFGSKIKAPGRTVQDFVSLIDLAPTFLDVARVNIPFALTGRSLRPILESDKSGMVESDRDSVVFGKERHVPSQEKPDMGGYPCRAIRTKGFLFIRNYRPDRWPNGTPDYKNAAIPGTWLGDTDNGPTKTYMVDNRDRDETHRRLYDLSFAKRPAVELYDLKSDPDQLNNVADKPQHADTLARLSGQLDSKLKASGDPRADGEGDFFDTFPYLGGGPKFPGFGRK
jgi:arylsulfatase A-like enzyme